jgi:hypothetical protein
MKDDTKPPIPERYVCDICGEEFETLSDLEEHKREHLEPVHETLARASDIRGDIGAAGLPTSPIQ